VACQPKQPKRLPMLDWVESCLIHKRLGWSVHLVACRMTSLAVIGRAVLDTTQENVIIEAGPSKIDDRLGNET